MFPRIFCALLISHGLLAAQEPVQTEAPASDEPAVTDTASEAVPSLPAQDVAATARTFIPSSLGVPLFTPPPPPVVKRLPAVRVDAAVTLLSKNARTLTLQRGEASTAPHRTCRRPRHHRPMSSRTNPPRRRSRNTSGNNATTSTSAPPFSITKSASSTGSISNHRFTMRPFAASILAC